MRSMFSKKVTDIKGIGKQLETKLAQKNIHSIQDLLFFFPKSYVNKTQLIPIVKCSHAKKCYLEGDVISKNYFFTKGRGIRFVIKDDSGSAEIKFFYYAGTHNKNIAIGHRLRVFGTARQGRNGIEFIHPEYEIVQKTKLLINENNLTPIYPNIKGVGQKTIQKIVRSALELTKGQKFNRTYDHLLSNLPDLASAIREIHFPYIHDSPEETELAFEKNRSRVALDELIAYFLLSYEGKNKNKGIPCSINLQLLDQVKSLLSFQLTHSQDKVLKEILEDLTADRPMNRLLQGDVGCGKTVVAFMAAASIIKDSFQVAIMAPTEILAKQHFEEAKKILSPLNLPVFLMIGSMKVGEKKDTIAAINQAPGSIIIGTHALFQQKMEFKNLGLVIIDEQHRFGVKQRLNLRQKRQDQRLPHQLFMSATPIPRTVAQTLFSDMSISTIEELPHGRKSIDTSVISEDKRANLVESLEKNILENNSQIYWVSPIISESDAIDALAAEEIFNNIKSLLPQQKIALIHGKLASEKKDQIMDQFINNQISILVATTLIEVGVNVPNANCMIIEGVERMGLAQIHQLRGRVGRGDQSSYCILIYKKPISDRVKKRLDIIRSNTSGFVIAEEDFKLRGPGNIFGTQQSGSIEFQVADISEHIHLAHQAKDIANQLKRDNPSVTGEVIDRWYSTNSEYLLA